MSVLEREIRNQAARVENDLASRKQHPTYGVTKAGLQRQVTLLEALLAAWAWTQGLTDTPVLDYAARDVQAAFGVDLTDLALRVKNA